jgi:subtilase family serine protease
MKTKIAQAQQRLLWACGFLAICATTVPQAGAQAAARIRSEINSAEQSTLPNSQHPMAKAQFDAGRLPADTRLTGITLTFNRSAAQESDLQSLIASQQNPASPLYHQWLTPDQFATRFGMADEDLAKVEGWLEQQGFSIDRVTRSKNAIHFSGSARQVEQAFSTEMHIYKYTGTATGTGNVTGTGTGTETSQHFAPSTALSVPAAIAPTVLGVTNLDDFRPRAHVILSKNRRVKPSFTSSQTGDVFFAPGDIATVYDISPLYNASVTGTGQSITLVGQSAIQVSDIEAFQSAAGLNVKAPTQFLVPASGNATVEQDGDEAESDIDLEWSGAIAPGATINFVYTGNAQTYGAFDALEYAIDEKIGTIISSSYGECEAALSGGTLGSGAPLETTLEAALEQAATQGQTVMSAAGDDGSTDCSGEGFGTTVSQSLAVDFPASSPYVTGMGGTEISSANTAYDTSDTAYWAAASTADVISSALQYIPEMAWNDDVAEGELSAGGGGTSALFQKPTWQTGVPGLSNSITMREVPDLALYASPIIPGYLYCSSDTSAWDVNDGQESSCTAGFRDSSSGLLTVAGGTSFDGPTFSGILALINQKQGYSSGQGLVNPTLYTLAANSTTYGSAFHDITTGNNFCTAGSPSCPSNGGSLGFAATTGYDQVTGLGSVDATNLAGAWPASTGVAPTLITTTTTITASNSAPNVGVSDTFTITVAASTGTATPTGTVTLTVDSNAPITETLQSNGTYVYTTSFSTAGSHTILATYTGDSTFATSNGSVSVNVAVVSSGTGTISLTPAPSPSTLSVAQGSTGTETISVTPAGGYTGTVDLNFDAGTAGDAALQNLCWEFTNTNSAGLGTLPISGGTAAVSTQLIFDTNASDCQTEAEMRKTGMRPMHKANSASTAKNSGGNPVPLTVAFAGLLLVGFMGRASRKLRGLAGLFVLAAVGLATTACSSGAFNNTVPNPPTGTYTITITAQDSVDANIVASPATFSFVITAAQ